ncbi:hypothetical protein G9C85_08005 [Halorubellus sp. JP-L1]|uniref:DUF7529 family protein n=1 Tax=Halorubellus sp. JP-L1 TaxID=2715753 RepID=UPI0014087ED0|nr:hypothetical protein [Halorubellus sp. JP-L1]NHN41579.1 hypothetical protein [Halorubellus sp. JP-L1]
MNEDHVDVDPEAHLPPEGVLDHWDAVVSDMEATAAEYREDGWQVVELHPGDIGVLSGQHATVDRYGLDLVVPGERAREIQDLVEAPDAAFDACSVFRAVEAGIVFLVVVLEDADREIAVVSPAFYDSDDETAQDMIEAATREGEMRTHVRDLASEHVSTFTHDDPSLFFPPAED